MEKIIVINDLIRKRRSIFPDVYNDQPIDRKIIEQVLENANWAPNHKHTEPWRFKVMQGKKLMALSEYMAEYYKTNTSEDSFKPMKYKKTKQKALRSACVIAICMKRHEGVVPEWEEVAAVACAVQNMWLTATAYNIGAYWSSTKSIKEVGGLLNLQADERCLGFFFMGHTDMPLPEGKRQSDWQSKVEWMID